MAIVTSLIPLQVYKKIHIQSVYSAIRRKLKPVLSCHYKFISAENIIIFSVSSDDFLHVRL